MGDNNSVGDNTTLSVQFDTCPAGIVLMSITGSYLRIRWTKFNLAWIKCIISHVYNNVTNQVCLSC